MSNFTKKTALTTNHVIKKGHVWGNQDTW